MTEPEESHIQAKEGPHKVNGSLERKQSVQSKQRKKGFVYFRLNAACWLILIHELVERFSFYGMKGLLTLFLKDYLNFSSNFATSIYHLFTGICYLLPAVGAVISDNYLGRFRTVLIFGIVYIAGHATMALSTLTWNRTGPLIGMFVLAVGAGIIKPCVAAFGGDQTPIDDEEATDAFFSLFYLVINVGAFVSQLLTPILKEDVDCVDGQCYPLAFGVPAVAFVLTYVLFLAGKPLYRFVKGEENVFVRGVKLIWHSIVRRSRLRRTGDKRENFLDYGDDAYDAKFINDVKIVLSVLILYLPFPVFWALFDQQGSRWSVQASQMNGRLTKNMVLYPEQMQMINPLLIVIIIPIFNNIVYPLLTKCNVLTRPPSRMVVGYVFAALSFVYACVLQTQIDKALVAPELASAQSLVRFANLGPCSVMVKKPGVKQWLVESEGLSKQLELAAPGYAQFELSAVACGSVRAVSVNVSLAEKSKYTLGMSVAGATIVVSDAVQDREVNRKGSKLRFMASPLIAGDGGVVELVKKKAKVGEVMLNFSEASTSNGGLMSSGYVSVAFGEYKVVHRKAKSNVTLGELEAVTGLVATVALSNESKLRIVEEVSPRLPLILLQIPQYVLMTIGEVLFSVTSLSFAYSESPSSMKAIMQSVYLVTIFFGNMIVTIVASLPSLPSQAWEFILFAGLVLVAGIVQGVLAYSFIRNKEKRQTWIQMNEEQTKDEDGESVHDDAADVTKL